MEVRKIEGVELIFQRVLIINAFILFPLIIVGGIALAISGFLPDETDEWISTNVYPNYSYLGLLFLANSLVLGVFNSSLYGKVKDGILQRLGF